MAPVSPSPPATLAAPPLRILICDDSPPVRRALASLLDTTPDLQVVGEAGTARAAIELATSLHPHLVLMDVHLPDSSGLEATRTLRTLPDHPKVLLLTALAEPEAALAALLSGASGYFVKSLHTAELLATIRALGQNSKVIGTLDPFVTLTNLHNRIGLVNAGPHPFAEPQNQILGLIENGLTNAELLSRLSLSPQALEIYLSDCFHRLGFYS